MMRAKSEFESGRTAACAFARSRSTGSPSIIMRDCWLERQITARFDQSAIAVRYVGVRNDAFNLCHREEALRLRQFHRLAIDDPITDHLLGSAEVGFRKLIMHLRDVVVDRPILVHENAEGHGRLILP